MGTNYNKYIEKIYHAAVAKPKAERAAFLKKVCKGHLALLSRVETLLKSREEADDFLEVSPFGSNLTLDNSHLSEGPGTKIGRYKLLELIGEGGFGNVYMAEQEKPIRRRVALKIIKLGMDTKQVIGRFEAERQALAMMDHINIAKVLDAGATETGRPYFVMELVKGIPITEYCDKNNLNTQQRLELFIDVCKAVQHAHQKGVIHRDIKPSNIMITLHDGIPVPKIIDFGIAKATFQRLTEKTVFTRYAQMIGTPEYMSPEQAEMSGLDVDTRTDIYSLGVLLYELLTGSTPFDAQELREAGYIEMQRIIRETEPPKPSTKLSTMTETITDIAKHRQTNPGSLWKLFRGDLDWIVMKALEKDRTYRYETASEFAQDILRHLDNEPVHASPHNYTYRIRKFVKKYRKTVAALFMIGVTLTLGIVISTTLLFITRQAKEEKDAALVVAQENEKEAVTQKTIVEDLLKQNEEARIQVQHLLAIAQLEDGLQLLNEGNPLGMLDLVDAWETAKDSPSLRASIGRLWAIAHDLSAGRLVDILPGSPIQSISPDGKYLVTVSGQTAQLLEMGTWQTHGPPLQLEKNINAVQFSPDSRLLVTHSLEGVSRLWDTATGQPVGPILQHDLGNTRIVNRNKLIDFSSDGKLLATGYLDDTVRLWNTATGQAYGKTIRHEWFQTLAFSPDGKLIATGGGQIAQLWDVATGHPYGPQMKTNGVVNFLLFSPDGKLLATKTGWDHNIRFWDTETGKLYKELHHNRLMLDIEFSSDGTLLAAGSEDRTALIWDITTGELMEKTTPHRGYVSVITFSRDGKLLVTYSADGKTVRLWDVAAGEPYGTQLHCPNAQGILSFSSDNEFLISPGNCIWKSHQPLHTEIIPYQPWASLGHSNPDGTISVMYKENTIRLWDMATKQAIGEPLECGYEITNIAFSPDGKRLACSYGGFHRFSPDLNVGQYGIGYIRLWEVSTGRPVGPILETGFAFSLTFSPDGKLLAVGTRDSTADVFDMTTWQRVQTLSCSGHVYAIAFSPDSKILAAGTNNGTVELWDMTTGEQIGVPLTLPSTVNSVTFSPDGNLLATVSGDEEQTVQIWDISSVTPYQGLVLPFSAMQGKEALQSFSKNGTIIVSRYGEDTAQAWRLPEEPTDLQEMQLKTWIALGARRNSQGEATSIPSSNWSLYKQELALRTQAHELQLVDVIDSSEANKVKLVWTPGPDTAAYQVYLGTDPKQLKLLDEVKEASYENVPALDRNKTYWWRIDSAKSDGSVMKGNLWTSRAGKLVGWWKFDEMESHRAADSSGNGLDGEFVDDARIVKDAERGNVLSLDGDGDYVDFGDDLKFDITNEITIAAWVNFRDIPSYWWMTIISKGDSAWRLSISENTRKYHFAVCNGSYGNYLDGKIELATDEWHHVCGTYDGEMIRLYVDGVLDTMLANNEAILTNNFNVCIGENQEAPGRYWDGLIDDVQVYSYAMSPMEIEAIYTGQELKLSNKPKWFFEVNSEESVQSDTQLDETTTYYVPLASEQKPEEEKSPTWSAVPSHDIEQVKSFISESTDPETKNIALQEACYAGNLDIVKFLIDIGADVNAWIGTRGTALLSATLANHKQIAELLIANGADVNRRNYIGQSILHFACQEGNKEIVQLLIDNKAYIEALNNYGQTPLNLAQQVGHTEIIELLREHGAAEVQSLHGAAATGNIERVKQLISEGADLEEKVNTSFGPNTTPLHMAAANGRTEVAKLLIDHGADVNAQEDEGWRETPLHHAASSGHRDVVELLINKGAEIDCKLSDGFTPLALAVEQGNRDIAELLIENGANVNVKNNEGGTPLHSSCQSGNKEVTELLIDHGADVNIKDRIDQTPLHLAQRGGHTEIVELLKQAESTEPYPDNRVKDIPINTILSWRSGKYADTHNVYIGTDFQDVNEASLDTTLGVTISEGQDVNSYHPGILDFNQTYYWRVDEVNKPPESSIYKGDVWSFTTGNCIIIDDFEGYKDSGSYTIRNTWHDGYENDENGSRIGHEVHPFLETRMVYAGGQSAPFKYDNTISPYSEISVDPANLAIGRDWSVGSPQTMVIWIHGDLGNIANDGLYARINNTKVEFEGNLSVPIWKKWNIDLTDLNLNLSNITNLSIGVEGSGTGMLFLDDILLYRNTPPIVQPVDPGTGNLVAQYAMENNVQDSSGNNLNGTTYGNPTYKQGLPGYGMALKLDGNDDYVDLPIGSAISTMNSCTITSWVKWSGNGGNWQRIFDFGTDTDINMYMTPRNGTLRLLQFAITTAGGNQESRFVALDSLSTNWQHIALVINGTSKTMRLYLDAQFFASSSTQLTPADLGQTTNNWLGRSQYTADPYFDGLLDDFRIYDTALSEGQIRYIAGDR